jgi:hypothetical protein
MHLFIFILTVCATSLISKCSLLKNIHWKVNQTIVSKKNKDALRCLKCIFLHIFGGWPINYEQISHALFFSVWNCSLNQQKVWKWEQKPYDEKKYDAFNAYFKKVNTLKFNCWHKKSKYKFAIFTILHITIKCPSVTEILTPSSLPQTFVTPLNKHKLFNLLFWTHCMLSMVIVHIKYHYNLWLISKDKIT